MGQQGVRNGCYAHGCPMEGAQQRACEPGYVRRQARPRRRRGAPMTVVVSPNAWWPCSGTSTERLPLAVMNMMPLMSEIAPKSRLVSSCSQPGRRHLLRRAALFQRSQSPLATRAARTFQLKRSRPWCAELPHTHCAGGHSAQCRHARERVALAARAVRLRPPGPGVPAASTRDKQRRAPSHARRAPFPRQAPGRRLGACAALHRRGQHPRPRRARRGARLRARRRPRRRRLLLVVFCLCAARHASYRLANALAASSGAHSMCPPGLHALRPAARVPAIPLPALWRRARTRM